MNSINKLEFENIISKIKNERNDYKYHISFDVDSLDPNYAPATGTPVENGMNVDNVKELLYSLKDKTIAYDIVEYNPILKPTNERDNTLENISEIIDIMY